MMRTRRWLVTLQAALALPLGPWPAQAQRGMGERALPGADRPLAIQMSDVYEIGAVDGAEWESFGRIRAVGFGPEGDLFVLDQQARAVYRVSSSGGYVGMIGGQGGGPGEYQLPTGLVVAPDGRVFVRDTGRGSWAVFARDGSYIANLRPDGSLGVPSDLRVAADGSMVGAPNDLLLVENGHLRRTYRVGGGDRPGDAERRPLVAFDSDGDQPRVIYEMWIPARNVGSNGMVQDVAFGIEAHWDVLPDGRAVVVDSVAWKVDVIGAHLGQDDQRLTRPIDPLPVTRRDREREIERRAALPNGGRSGGMISSGGSEEEARRDLARAMRERLRTGLAFPEVRPVIRGVMVDWAGRIWVARTSRAVDPDAPGPIDVLDGSGRYLGTIDDFRLPDAFGPGGLAAWVGLGEFDVPVVRVRRIRLPD